MGALVSGALWLFSAAVSARLSARTGIIVMVVGGPLIFPVTQALLRATGPRASLSAHNRMGQLATQVALTIPLCFPLVGAAAIYQLNWFYPAMMVVVGMHYLPFVFLYGMPLYAVLCGLLVAGGILLGLYATNTFTLGGWLTGLTLIAFAFPLKRFGARERRG